MSQWSKFKGFLHFLMTLKMFTRLTILLCIITTILLVYYGFALAEDDKIICADIPIKAVKQLCDLYKTNQVTGNYCPHICSNVNTLHSQTQCFNIDTHNGKEVVFELTLKNNTKVVVKSQYSDLSKYSPAYSMSGYSKVFPNLKQFTRMIRDTLNAHVKLKRFGHIKRLIKQMWIGDFNEDLHHSNPKFKAAMTSLWSLMQQREYMLFRLFEGKDIFTRVLGYCGHFYVVEYMDSIETDYEYWRKSRTRQERPWIEKIKLSREIIRILGELENYYPEPLHLCDVKLAHFGYAGITNFVVKILDADASFFGNALNKMVNNSETCTKHSDCAFFDCLSTCDNKVQKCLTGVTNNNLQVICSKIFNSDTYHFDGFRGLLTNPPEKDEDLKDTIEGLLNLCSNPSESDSQDLRYGAPAELSYELQLFLDSEIFKSKPFIKKTNHTITSSISTQFSFDSIL